MKTSVSEDIVEGKPIRSDTEAWAVIGRKLLEESIVVGREYSKVMIQFSFGAIPIYVSLFGLMTKRNETAIGVGKMFVIFTPVILFLACSLIFIWGYYPRASEMHVNVVESIQRNHQTVIKRRGRLNLVGTIAYALAVLLSAGILLTLNG